MTNKPELTDERISNATLIRLIKWAEQHNSHYVEAALRELQERRKADGPEPKQGDHVSRMHQEFSELNDRANKLAGFISNNPLFGELKEKDKELMREQLASMRSYERVLGMRVCRAELAR